MGYSLFPTRRILHGAHIRPYEICRELGVTLGYSTGLSNLPIDFLKGIAEKETLILFPGYTADQLSLLLIYLAKLRHCKLIIDIADIPYLQYKYFHGAPSAKSINDFAQLVHLADILLYSTHSLRTQTEKLLVTANKPSHVIENASDPNHFSSTPLPGRKVILFVGGYIPARGVDELIEAFRILLKRGNNCVLRLVGFGYPQAIEEPGVEILQDVYYDKIPNIYSDCYVFVIPHRPNLYMRIAAPIKLFDAMASGRPIVSTPCNETVAVIEKERCGVVTESEPPSMADGIEYLLDNRDIASEMGKRGRIAVERRNSWKIRADKLRRIIRE